MKKISVRSFLVMFVSLAMVNALATSATIGIATAKGSFRVDDSYVAGNATLFEGAAVETGASTGELNLSRARVVLAIETRGRVFQDRLILDRGQVQWSGQNFRTLAGELQIVGADNASKATVIRKGEAVRVASLSGTVNVLSAAGEMVASVAAGNAYEFVPDPQGASPGDKADPNQKKKKKAAAAVVGMSVTAKVLIGVAVVGAGGAAAGAVVATRDGGSSSSATVSR